MENEVIEILIDASGLADAEGGMQGLTEAGNEAVGSIGRLSAITETGGTSLSAFADAASTAAKALDGETGGNGGVSKAADQTAKSLSRSASSALSAALKDVVIDGDSFSAAASALSTRLASSALTTVSNKMFDSLLSGLFTGFSGGGFSFADGGVMTAAGPVALRGYASGGVADEPQLALFGEGSSPEAYVPLPDGRSIPVTMRGGGSAAPPVTIQMSVTAQDAASFRRSEGQIGATVAAKLQRHMQRYG